jgi:two-component system phosphate regulon response regulator PhoB
VRVLVVEDEAKLASLLRQGLRRRGMAVDVAGTAEEAVMRATTTDYDVILLDVMLPGFDGFEVCRRLRAHEVWSPTLMLTALDEVEDRVRGLDSGADDYVTKPFSTSELIARLRAVIRRARPATNAEILRFGDLALDLSAHRVSRAGQPIHLGPTEFRLLRFFLERPGRVFSREQLLDAVWGRDAEVELRTVDVHIRRLRKALNEGGHKDLVRTVRAAGYALDQGVGAA